MDVKILKSEEDILNFNYTEPVIVDMSTFHIIPSRIIVALVENKDNIVILNPSYGVLYTLKLCNLHQILTITHNLEQAKDLIKLSKNTINDTKNLIKQSRNLIRESDRKIHDN